MTSSPNMSCLATSLVVLIFQATFNPFIVANAQRGIIPRITSLVPGLGGSVIGTLCCPGTGATCPGFGIANTTVFLNCTTLLGTSIILGQATTNASGAFNITVPNISNVLSIPFGGTPILSCAVTANLPLNSTICPIVNTANGLLVSVTGFVGTLLTQTLGLIRVFATVNGFSILPLALL